MSRRFIQIVLAALVGACALSAVVVLSRVSYEAPSSATAPVVTASTRASTVAAPVPHAAAASKVTVTPIDLGPTVDEVLDPQAPLDVLLAGLAATDAVIVAESANALVARNVQFALPTLLETDIVARPWAAPSVIYALGRLGAKAHAEEREDVVEHLLALMKSEKERASNEALANVLHIYEALGQTGDSRAIAPLERELTDPRVATAPKVVVVQALVALGARQSRATLERVRDQLAPTATGEDFEAAVRRDLLAEIRDALVKLS